MQGSRRLAHVLLLSTGPQVSCILTDWTTLQNQSHLNTESVCGPGVSSTFERIVDFLYHGLLVPCTSTNVCCN